jgi:signal transduction histidine kinase
MQYSIELPESSNEIILTNQQRRNILLATKEIVHNAVKHSDAKEIWIKGIIKNNDFEMEIKDNGKGVDVDKVYRGNGLKNIRHRVEEIGGNLLILSEPGEMTKFFYSIPITATT